MRRWNNEIRESSQKLSTSSMLKFWTKCHFWKCKGPFLGKKFSSVPIRETGKSCQGRCSGKGSFGSGSNYLLPLPYPSILVYRATRLKTMWQKEGKGTEDENVIPLVHYNQDGSYEKYLVTLGAGDGGDSKNLLITAIFALLLASTKICSIRPKAANSKQTNRIYDVQHVNATLRTNWNFLSLVWRVLLNNNQEKNTTYQLPEEAQKHFLVYSESGTPKNNANTNSSFTFPFHLFLIEQVSISRNKHKGPHDKVAQLNIEALTRRRRIPYLPSMVHQYYYCLLWLPLVGHQHQSY